MPGVQVGPAGVLVGGLDDGLLLDVHEAAFVGREESSAHPDAHAADRKGCCNTPAVSDTAGSEHGRGRCGVYSLRPKGEGADTARMPSAFVSLGRHQIHTGLGDPSCILRVAAEPEDLHAGGMGLFDHEAGIPETGAEERHPFLDAGLHRCVGTYGGGLRVDH